MIGERIVVVGSANLDLVVGVERHPTPGETLIGSDYELHPGGKGANQAVAAARLGGDVAFVGCVGDDEFGSSLGASLSDAGVDVAALKTVKRPSGVAFIQVDADGQNTIVVSPGANSALMPDAAEGALARGCAVLCLQLEVPLETVLAAANVARRSGAAVLLNLAPALRLSAEQLADVTHLLVNEHEAALLLETTSAGVLADPDGAARRLTSLAPNAVVTLGQRGAVWARRSGVGERATESGGAADGEGTGGAGGTGGAEGTVELAGGGTVVTGRQPAFKVDAVDTTAAGDAFAGALATRLALIAGGSPASPADDHYRQPVDDLAAAVRYASAAAALATTRRGAQPSLATAAEVEALLARAG
ncbi:MAG TPA: ribokinase [Trueperaceae bacterium]|nr:ribokinase [Trueperaceae bacterium]